MTSDSMKAAACSVEELLFDNWFDPIETALRGKRRCQATAFSGSGLT